MTTIWLASYPKSGNTWMRALLEALFLPPGTPLDINALSRADMIASDREAFEYHTLLDSDLLTFEEADLLRPGVYTAAEQRAVQDALPVRFVKVHDAYSALSDGRALLGGAKAAAGAILIVRDPRDIAPSLAHHLGVDLDTAIARMNDSNCASNQSRHRLNEQLRQRLGDWSGHARSWLDQRDIPVHLVRYEDMIEDTAAALAGVLDFSGCSTAAARIAEAVAMAQFSELAAAEEKHGFRETSQRAPDGRFFRRGRSGGWVAELTPAQALRIEIAHAAMMQRLGYPLSGAIGRATNGFMDSAACASVKP